MYHHIPADLQAGDWRDKKHSPNFNIYERVNVPVKLLEKIILGLLGVMAVVIIAAIVISNL